MAFTERIPAEAQPDISVGIEKFPRKVPFVESQRSKVAQTGESGGKTPVKAMAGVGAAASHVGNRGSNPRGVAIQKK
ncbi:MAG: hypothetical protein JXA30_00290 [Deltaproteobacteria bacterium]|nr:hypothetical protein [Deltaproteobacteria bacterium]